MSQPKRVLIVDDQPPSRSLLEALVKSLGHQAILAQDGLEALGKAKRDIDLILLDAVMPGMDGFAVARRLRQELNGKPVPILMVTALRSKTNRLRAFQAGVTDFISKPIDRTELRLRLTSLLALKEAQDVRHEHYRDLEDFQAGLEAFVASMSQDLDAPVQILKETEVFLNDHDEELHPVVADSVRRFLHAAQRMEQMLKDLAAYHRFDQGALLLEPVSLHWVVPEVLSRLDQDIRDRNAHVTVEEPLPAVVGHQATLVQVLAHLVANALKFVASGVAPQIRLWAEEEGPWVRLWVEDNGLGIGLPQEHRSRLFRPFERLHRSTAYPGTGLGLAIVRRGVERMGGRVGVDSKAGQGSRFWFALPKVDQKTAAKGLEAVR